MHVRTQPKPEALAVQIARRNYEHAHTAEERAWAARRLAEAQAAAKAVRK